MRNKLRQLTHFLPYKKIFGKMCYYPIKRIKAIKGVGVCGEKVKKKCFFMSFYRIGKNALITLIALINEVEYVNCCSEPKPGMVKLL